MSNVTGGLCSNYGCIPYNPNNLCQCNIECKQNDSCCSDFEFQCEGLKGFEHEELLAQNKLAIFSDIIGIICFIIGLSILIFGCRKVNIYLNKNDDNNKGNINDNENDIDNDFDSDSIEINRDQLSGSEKPIIYTSLISVTFYVFSLLAYIFANISNTNESFLVNQMASFLFWSVGYTILYLNLFLHYHYITEESRILDVSLKTNQRCKDIFIHIIFIIIVLMSSIAWLVFFIEFGKYKWNNKKIYNSIIIGIIAHVSYTVFITILYIRQLFRLMLSRSNMLLSTNINSNNNKNVNNENNNSSSNIDDISKASNNARLNNINKVTRITVLRCIGTLSTVILIVFWSLLFIEEDTYEGESYKVSIGLWNFSWWIFPIDSVLNSLNVLFSVTLFDKYYHKICCCCHNITNKICQNITNKFVLHIQNQPINGHDMDKLR